MTTNVQQTAGMLEPTDLSAVNNLNAVTLGGYGGPHAVFDRDHYKAQMRIPNRLIEFNAAQGAVIGHGYTWVINLLAYDDNYVTERLSLPQTSTIKTFMDEQMQIFFEKYKPVYLYFPATDHDILAVNFNGTY
jgi:hypothetical protein